MANYKNVDMVQLKAICRMKPTLKDCAAFFEVSEDTIEARIRKEYKCTFSEFREQNMVHTRFSLIRTAIRKAENGDNTMLIFCLKNLCGWADKQEQITIDKSETIETFLKRIKEQTDKQ
jgi:uncharacterized protein YbcV (DUF1398 family)